MFYIHVDYSWLLLFTDIKALELASKVQLAKQENSALHETMSEINSMISSCPLASAEGKVQERREKEREREMEQLVHYIFSI